MHATAHNRAARRDYWNDPKVISRARLFDSALRILAVTAVMILGSIAL